MKQYNKDNILRAKELRKNMTPWERKLWYEFLRQYPVRIQRQKSLGDYIADFYCAKAGLVIELDGGGHYEPENMQADEMRTAALNRLNLKVLRICNLDIDKNFRGVCEHIDRVICDSLPQSASLTAPSSEGAIPNLAKKQIFALGFFDGVHLGHQALLAQCKLLAAEQGCRAGVVTFEGHPDTLVRGTTPGLINTPADRERLLTEFGVDTVISLPFDKKMMTMPWQDFIAQLLEYGAAGFVCGNDFRFGHRGEGNAEKLQAFCDQQGLPCTVVPEQTLDGIRVSSTHIRSLLENGEMETAVKFLGHPHILTGTVVPGRQLGRTIGIPTANLALPQEVLVPKFGVYACLACVGEKKYPAVTNIGTRPTVGGHHVTVEPWLLDFEGDLYGQELTLEFYKFLRPEQKFDSLEDLKQEIKRNAEQTKEFLTGRQIEDYRIRCCGVVGEGLDPP